MRLLFKFNIVFLIIFAVGLYAAAYVSRDLLDKNARSETAENARLLMDAALAARAYTSGQINPLLETQLKYSFPPQSVPAYSANAIFDTFRKSHEEYAYKEATLNPTNPRNRAVDWEVEVVNRFRDTKETTEFIGERNTKEGRFFYVARPIRIANPACLRCHSTVEAAPETMIEKYGKENGFGWKLNEVVGAQIISVPTKVPQQRADAAFRTFMTSISVVLIAIGVVLNFMLWFLVIRPVVNLSHMAVKISLGHIDTPEIHRRSKDEIGVLAESIERMRTSLAKAMTMLRAR
jgi:HAMP domain-containing protein